MTPEMKQYLWFLASAIILIGLIAWCMNTFHTDEARMYCATALDLQETVKRADYKADTHWLREALEINKRRVAGCDWYVKEIEP